MTKETLAQEFHEAYERLAPQFGYETRRDSAVPWESVPEKNRNLMIAVCGEVLATFESDLRLERAVALEKEAVYFETYKRWPVDIMDKWTSKEIAARIREHIPPTDQSALDTLLAEARAEEAEW